jgi:2-dehydropantoate 2-reductase
MRIAIVGAGGVGGLLAGLLARAGEEVLLVARGAHLEAIRARGLRVDSPLGHFTVRLSAVSDDPASLGQAEAILLAVKAWQVEEAAPRLRPLLAPGAVVVPLQNGVEAAERLAALLPAEAVAGGVINVISWIDGPGAVKHAGVTPRVSMGERGPRAARESARLAALARALESAGMEARVAPDVERAVWEKFILVEPWGAVAAASRAPFGVVRLVPELRRLHVAAMEEVLALARARGVALAPDVVESTLSYLETIPADATVSMQRDLGAARPSELDDQLGAVSRLAAQAKVPAPIHDVLYAALLPQELAARGRIPRFPRT